ncbi:MAG: YwiC-like family protein [Acidimicrobiia bacterium]|nr:YwiC-like family protein [Acidimicrobiia bacterium]
MRRGEPGSLRAVALPTEHGGWGFTLEPVLLGLLVAPGLAGGGVAAAAVAVFLARRPLRLLAEDLRRGRRLPRTAMAAGVVAAGAAIAIAGLAFASCRAGGRLWWAVAAALPAAGAHVAADLTHRSRSFWAEAAGAVAMGAAAPALALAGGWEAGPAFALWAVIAGRALPSILFVRAQFRRARGEPAAPAVAHFAHGIALAGLAALAAADLLPWTAAAAAAFLWAFAMWALARPPVPARTLGWTQMAVGFLVVGLVATGHHLGC